MRIIKKVGGILILIQKLLLDPSELAVVSDSIGTSKPEEDKKKTTLLQKLLLDPYELSELAEVILSNMEISSPEEELKTKLALHKVVEEDRINWYEFSRLPIRGRRATIDSMIKIGILTTVYGPRAEVFQVSSLHSLQPHFIPFSEDEKDSNCKPGEEPQQKNTINVYFYSIEDARAYASSLMALNGLNMVVDRISVKNGKVSMEVIEILQNDLRGKNWIGNYLPKQNQ